MNSLGMDNVFNANKMNCGIPIIIYAFLFRVNVLNKPILSRTPVKYFVKNVKILKWI